MKLIPCCLCLTLMLGLPGCRANQPETKSAEPAASKTTTPTPEPLMQPLLLAHYMPWYQTPEQSGFWGWHWKMDHFDPEQVGADGLPQIASHYHPLTGPYDSKDTDLLEYQVLLMKLSGIDGVIVDWYGSSSFRDYSAINQATGRLFAAIKKAGLLFAICYEDQTVRHMVADGRLVEVPGSSNSVYSQLQADLQYLQDTWFKDDAYLKFEGQPVLFNFGPQYFINGADWEAAFAALEMRPALVTLAGNTLSAAIATYPWPPMSLSQNGVLSPVTLEGYLNGFYDHAEKYPLLVAGVFPGFHDIYAEAGVGSSYGFLDAKDGETFELTLRRALAYNPDVIQLITWNDYGEGTIIEPTHELGYRYLEMLQQAQPQLGRQDFKFSAQDLRLPLKLFGLRKAHDDPETRARLDEVFQLLVNGDVAGAQKILADD